MLTGGQLLLCDGTGERTGTVPLNAGSGMGTPRGQFAGRVWSRLASAPSGRLAVASDGGFLTVLGEQDSRVPQPLMHGMLPPYPNGICFAGPGLVAASSGRGVRLQPLEGGMTSPGMPDGHDFQVLGDHPVAVTQRNEVAVLGPGPGGRVSYINTETHALRTERRELSGQTGYCLFGTPDGNYHALGGDEFAAIAWPDASELAALAGEPQARWRPGDLATVKRAVKAGYCPGAVSLLALMLASLEHQFGAELAIGRLRPTAASDDIELSDGKRSMPSSRR
jgi:hypothetical protein